MRKRLAAMATAAVVMLSGACVAFAGADDGLAGQLRERARTSLTSAVELASVPSAQTDMWGKRLTDDFYLYRGLLGDEQKKAYDTICEGMLRAQPSIPMDASITSDDVTPVVSCVLRDHPEIFWTSSNWAWTMAGDGTVLSVEPEYSELADNLDASRAAFEWAANPLILFASHLDSDIDKAKAVHDWIALNVRYEEDSPHNQDAWSVFMNGRSVCAGYAAAFQYAMQKLGIPAAYVTGQSGGEAHAWNLVQLDGQFYALDITFDDPIPDVEGRVLHDYFLVSDEQLAADHARDGFSEPLPAATGTLGDGVVVPTTDFAAYSPEDVSLPQTLAKGDLTGDGGPTLASIILCVRYAQGELSLTDAQRQAADMNSDGEVNLTDATAMADAISARQ